MAESRQGNASRKPAKTRKQGSDKPASAGKGRSRSASGNTKNPAEPVRRAKKAAKRAGNNPDPGWIDRLGTITTSALSIARKTTDGSVKVGKSILKSQDQIKLMVAAGQSLKDLREVAGLTVNELGEALNLKDKSFWEAVENGTATISFELILRLAALLARNDPVPFVLKYTRTYNPELWKTLNDWGFGRLPLNYEREREFINIYRRHDAARNLSDEAFNKVLGFTRQSFEMALHFAVEQESISDNLQKNLDKATPASPQPATENLDTAQNSAAEPEPMKTTESKAELSTTQQSAAKVDNKTAPPS